MWPRFGIKIGNSTVCVASAKDDGKIEVIANKHGNRVSQAALLLDSGEIEVGLTAKQKLTSKGTGCVINNFQLFAKNLSSTLVTNAVKYLTCQYNRDLDKYMLKETPKPGGNSDEPIDIGSLSPYQVCVEFFKASFELARQCHILEDHPAIVLSIPHYYATESWMNLATAAEEAGFHVSQVIPEHTAAILAYELFEEGCAGPPKRVLCIKSGGLLTSFSLFDIHDGLASIVDSAGPYYIGGKQFTDVLEEFISKEFCKKYKLDPQESRRSIAKIQTAAENCKHILTSLPSTQIYIDSLMDGVDFNVQMSRARYEMLIQPPLNEFMTVLNEAVDIMLAKDESDKAIDEIVIAGGTMKIPKIQSAINSRFPDAKMHSHHPPDEVVAIGCARQSLYADLENQELESDTKCSCITSDIYVWHDNNFGQQQLVLEKGTLLPTQTVVDIEKFTSHSLDTVNSNIFHVQTQDCVGEIQVCDAKANDGVYRIKAIIEEIDGRPKITLSNGA